MDIYIYIYVEIWNLKAKCGYQNIHPLIKNKKNDKMLKGGMWAFATYQLKIRELTSHE